MKSFILSLSFVVFVCWQRPVFPQEATAVINGPRDISAGELVLLDASRSQGCALHWALLNSKRPFLTFEGGRKLVFASGTPGEYVFVLVVGHVDVNKNMSVAIAEHRVIVGGSPSPSPPGPDLPHGRWGFAQAAHSWITQRVLEDKRHHALELAKNFEATADAIEDGDYDGLPANEAVSKANLALQSRNRATLKYLDANSPGDAGAWLPFFAAWQEKAVSHNPPTKEHPHADGTLRTVRDYAQAYRETALGLKSAITTTSTRTPTPPSAQQSFLKPISRGGSHDAQQSPEFGRGGHAGRRRIATSRDQDQAAGFCRGRGRQPFGNRR